MAPFDAARRPLRELLWREASPFYSRSSLLAKAITRDQFLINGTYIQRMFFCTACRASFDCYFLLSTKDYLQVHEVIIRKEILVEFWDSSVSSRKVAGSKPEEANF
jgi:hypothetical protein